MTRYFAHYIFEYAKSNGFRRIRKARKHIKNIIKLKYLGSTINLKGLKLNKSLALSTFATFYKRTISVDNLYYDLHRPRLFRTGNFGEKVQTFKANRFSNFMSKVYKRKLQQKWILLRYKKVYGDLFRHYFTRAKESFDGEPLKVYRIGKRKSAKKFWRLSLKLIKNRPRIRIRRVRDRVRRIFHKYIKVNDAPKRVYQYFHTGVRTIRRKRYKLKSRRRGLRELRRERVEENINVFSKLVDFDSIDDFEPPMNVPTLATSKRLIRQLSRPIHKQQEIQEEVEKSLTEQEKIDLLKKLGGFVKPVKAPFVEDVQVSIPKFRASKLSKNKLLNMYKDIELAPYFSPCLLAGVSDELCNSFSELAEKLRGRVSPRRKWGYWARRRMLACLIPSSKVAMPNVKYNRMHLKDIGLKTMIVFFNRKLRVISSLMKSLQLMAIRGDLDLKASLIELIPSFYPVATGVLYFIRHLADKDLKFHIRCSLDKVITAKEDLKAKDRLKLRSKSLTTGFVKQILDVFGTRLTFRRPRVIKTKVDDSRARLLRLRKLQKAGLAKSNQYNFVGRKMFRTRGFLDKSDVWQTPTSLMRRFRGVLTRNGLSFKAERILRALYLRIKFSKDLEEYKKGKSNLLFWYLARSKPIFGLKPNKRGNVTTYTPIVLNTRRATAKAQRDLVSNVKKRTESSLDEKLCNELIATLEKRSTTYKLLTKDTKKAFASRILF